ncbi:hypothetical protein SAMN04489724_4357 [Algoriphagus locisalis]|uniref:Uncharacterized protein n=1 Tax=Algoriphagus locisalis TaxID=305507 RepID=A0A1I7DTX8_9BACT|nr:hypothetical protein SAMN04489724_4357 [Algoriphagus locisalis]
MEFNPQKSVLLWNTIHKNPSFYGFEIMEINFQTKKADEKPIPTAF